MYEFGQPVQWTSITGVIHSGFVARLFPALNRYWVLRGDREEFDRYCPSKLRKGYVTDRMYGLHHDDLTVDDV